MRQSEQDDSVTIKLVCANLRCASGDKASIFIDVARFNLIISELRKVEGSVS